MAGAKDILFPKRDSSRQLPEVSHILPEKKNAVHTSISQSQTVYLRLESILIFKVKQEIFFLMTKMLMVYTIDLKTDF